MRTVSDVIIHEVEEPLSSEKCSGGSEKSLKDEKEISSLDHFSEDLTVIGRTINVVVNAPCFCHASTKRSSSTVATSSKTTTLVATLSQADSSTISQIPLKQLRSDQCTSTSDLLEQTVEPEEHQDQVQIDVDIDADNADYDDNDSDDDEDEEDGQDTYSCSSVSSRSSRDPSCPRCFIIANTDCSKAVYV